MKKLIILTIILFTVQFLAPISAQTEQKPRLVVQTGHSEPISAIAFSPNGRLIASGGGERQGSGTLKLWDVFSGAEIRSFDVSNKISSLFFSKDGKMLISGGYYQEVMFWDIKTGELLKTIESPFYAIDTIYLSPDNKTLLVGGIGTAIYNFETGQEIFKAELTNNNMMIVSSDGKYLAGKDSPENNKIMIFDIVKKIKLRPITGLSDEVCSFAFSENSRILAVGSCKNNNVKLLDVITGTILKIYKTTSQISSIYFSPERKSLIGIGVDNRETYLWDISSSQKIISYETNRENNLSSFSFDGKKFATINIDNKIGVWDIESKKESVKLTSHSSKNWSVASSKNGEQLVIGTQDGMLKLWDVKKGIVLNTFGKHSENVYSVAFSKDENFIASGSGAYIDGVNEVKIWDIATGKEIKTLKESDYNESVFSVSFSEDGKLLASGEGSEFYSSKIRIWNIATGKSMKTLTGHSAPVEALSFSPDGKLLASGGRDNVIKLWNVSTGDELKTIEGNTDWIMSLVFSPDGTVLASYSIDHKLKYWQIESGKELFNESTPEWIKFNGVFAINNIDNIKTFIAPDGEKLCFENYDKFVTRKDKPNSPCLIFLDQNDWIITTPDGRFDTNKLENPQGLHWIMPDAPFTPLSFEVFMRDYYEPNLLPRLLKCNEEANCEQEFKPVRNLTELNRTQPKVRITEIMATDLPEIVQVTVEAEDVMSEYQRDKQNKPLRSGVADLRLFRDGQLVGYAPDADGAVALDKNGKFTKTFNVKLPKNRDAKEFNFTAYAFNVDRVKSETASQSFTLPKPLPMAKGNAYIVTIGVNANEDSRYDLRYAANDARRLQEELAKNLPADKYQKIVRIPLISDYDKDGAMSENNATKAKIKAVLEMLAAGKTVSPDALKDVPNAASLKKVSPEDLVLIAFSGHGYADQNGIFYLLPSDIGKSADGSLAGVLQKSISSDELSLWLRDVDAGEMLMIVDACHSAAAVQGSGFKPGPMGSRGLGQLSYDKGMRILTATQAGNVALEVGQTADGKKIEGGLLTFSLVTNGIELGFADYQPKDTKIFSNEWLGFAVKDVPVLYEEISKGVRKDLLIDGKPKSGVFQVNGQTSNLNLQQPTLFDFSRRDRQYELLNDQ